MKVAAMVKARKDSQLCRFAMGKLEVIGPVGLSRAIGSDRKNQPHGSAIRALLEF
jgi:hypothetical protein